MWLVASRCQTTLTRRRYQIIPFVEVFQSAVNAGRKTGGRFMKVNHNPFESCPDKMVRFCPSHEMLLKGGIAKCPLNHGGKCGESFKWEGHPEYAEKGLKDCACVEFMLFPTTGDKLAEILVSGIANYRSVERLYPSNRDLAYFLADYLKAATSEPTNNS
jgi:hypothetical protein